MMIDYLAIQQPQLLSTEQSAKQSASERLNYNRYYEFAQSNNKTNVIVVILESFASYKTSLSGNPLDSTPNIARLASEGYYFKNFFTPSTGTARSIWTFVTGLLLIR